MLWPVVLNMVISDLEKGVKSGVTNFVKMLSMLMNVK